MSMRLRATPWFRSEPEEKHARRLRLLNLFLDTVHPPVVFILHDPPSYIYMEVPVTITFHDLPERPWDEQGYKGELI